MCKKKVQKNFVLFKKVTILHNKLLVDYPKTVLLNFELNL